MDLLSQITHAQGHFLQCSGQRADAIAIHPADWVRLEADLRADLPFAVGVYTPARPGARPRVAGATVYVADQVAPGQIVTAPEAEIRAMLGLDTPATHLYAVAITAHGPEPDARIETHIQCFAVPDLWAALGAAEDWAAAHYAERPGPWFYQYAGRPVVALGAEQQEAI